jgi:hypothetical protein
MDEKNKKIKNYIHGEKQKCVLNEIIPEILALAPFCGLALYLLLKNRENHQIKEVHHEPIVEEKVPEKTKISLWKYIKQWFFCF